MWVCRANMQPDLNGCIVLISRKKPSCGKKDQKIDRVMSKRRAVNAVV